MGFVLIDFIFQFIVWGEVKVIVRSSSVYKRTQIVPEPLNCSVNGLLWRVPVGSVCINLDFSTISNLQLLIQTARSIYRSYGFFQYVPQKTFWICVEVFSISEFTNHKRRVIDEFKSEFKITWNLYMNFNRIPNVLRRSFPKKNKNRYDEFIPHRISEEKN